MSRVSRERKRRTSRLTTAALRPLIQACVAAAIFCAVRVGRAFEPVRHFVATAIRLAARGLRRVGFVRSDDLSAALFRLDLLRVLLSVLLFARFYPEVAAARHHTEPAVQIALASGCLMSGMLAVGIATPLAALALALGLNLVIDVTAGTYSLGSLVAANCLIPLLVTPAGYTCSIDAWLLRRPTRIGALWRRLYGFWGPPELDRLHVGQALALVAYAILSLYSAWQHLASPTWRSGAMTAVLFLSPIANPTWAPLAQRLYHDAPAALLVFSRITTYGMLVWQLCLLPLALFSRVTRGFVIVWGLMYFAIATVVLHLKQLGAYEVVLWGLVFWNSAMPAPSGGSPVAELKQGRFAAALLLGMVLLTAAFVGEWVGIQDPLRGEVIRRHAPMVAGLGFVHVFNEVEFALYRHRTAAYEQQPTGEWREIALASTERVDQQLTDFLYRDALVAQFCDPQYAYLWFDAYRATLPPADPRRLRPMKMVFSVWTHPTNADFAVMNATPMVWETTCVLARQ